MTTTRLKGARAPRPVDLTLFTITCLLVMLGLWMVLDTSYPGTLDSAKAGGVIFSLMRGQMVGAFLGMVILFCFTLYPYQKLRNFSSLAIFGSIILLSAVWIPHVGIRLNNSNRWIGIGPVVIQSSEIAKMSLMLYAAAFLTRKGMRVRELTMEGIVPLLIVAGLILLLIEKEPDLGTAVVLFMALLTQLYLAGARKRHLIIILTVSGLAVLLFMLHGSGIGHRMARIQEFMHPGYDPQGVGYQVVHSRMAVGSGEWYGVGLGRGKEKYYLPQANSDFIFATYAEETGFAGSMVLLILLLTVGVRGFQIAAKAPDKFGCLLAGGIASVITWQALVNIAVATGSIPATGVPLPFISHGSSSLILLLAGVGIQLNISQQQQIAPAEVVPV